MGSRGDRFSPLQPPPLVAVLVEQLIDHIEHAWHQSDTPPPMAEFVAGSWGPREADQLLHQDGNQWRRL